MRITDHLSDEQILDLLFSPLSKEAEKQLDDARRASSWLLNVSLNENVSEEMNS